MEKMKYLEAVCWLIASTLLFVANIVSFVKLMFFPGGK